MLNPGTIRFDAFMAWGLAIVTAVMLFVPLGLFLLRLSNSMLGDRPTMVRSTTDFCWVLFGLSGFLLGAIPVSLARLHDKVQLSALAGEAPALAASPWFWAAVHAGYFGLVVVLAAVEMIGRRRRSCLYLINPTHLTMLMVDAFWRLGWEAQTRSGAALVHLPPPEHAGPRPEIRWDDRPMAGVCEIDWGLLPEPRRAELERCLDDLLTAEHCGSLVPGVVLLVAAGALIMGSLALSVLQLMGLFPRF
jgi:hypothetical protein